MSEWTEQGILFPELTPPMCYSGSHSGFAMPMELSSDCFGVYMFECPACGRVIRQWMRSDGRVEQQVMRWGSMAMWYAQNE